MRILIAEDERDLNDLITQRLIQEHYSVDSCYDGEEALDFLRMADYDALILDIMMPRLDGLSVLRTLRENKNDVAVLLLTAKDSIEDRVRGWMPVRTIISSSRLPLKSSLPGCGCCYALRSRNRMNCVLPICVSLWTPGRSRAEDERSPFPQKNIRCCAT